VNKFYILELKKISAGWLALALPVIGAGIFYLWQPITDYFVTGAFDENVVLLIDTETVKSDTKNHLLVVHVKASNRGNVPVTIKTDGGVGQIALQIRRIENPLEAKWLDPEKLPLVAEKNSLRNHNGVYVIAPNAFYEEVEAIPLPSATYWIKGSIIFENGEYIDQSAVVNHSLAK
jgi:hypothetical protein